jgi:hypothetical protein
MADKKTQQPDPRKADEPGNRRFTEVVDKSKTPEEEAEDPQRRSGGAGRQDATTK